MSYNFTLKDPLEKDEEVFWISLTTKDEIYEFIKLIDFDRDMQHRLLDKQYIDLSFDITFNYTGIIDLTFDRSIKELGLENPEDLLYSNWFKNKKAGDVIPLLENMISKLSTKDFYHEGPSAFKPTEGNCRAALGYLLASSKIRPDGIWNVK